MKKLKGEKLVRAQISEMFYGIDIACALFLVLRHELCANYDRTLTRHTADALGYPREIVGPVGFEPTTLCL